MTMTQADVAALWEALTARVGAGDRFAGLSGAQPAGGPLVLSAHVATAGGIDTLEAPLPPGAAGYPALTPRLGAAFWYERVIHDRFGVDPGGPPRLAPLIGPGRPRSTRCPGTWPATASSPSRTARSAPGSWSRSSTWSRRPARRSRT